MGNDIEIRVRVANQTQGGFTSINTSLNTLRDRARGAATAMTALRAAASDINLAVRLDDRTAAGFTRVRQTINDLRRESPIRIAVRFDSQSSQVNSTTRAMRGLRTAARDTGQSLTTLATRALASAVALQRLAAAADDAAGQLRELATASALTTAALAALNTAASRAANSVGRLGDRAETSEGQLFHLRGTVIDLSGDMNLLGDSSRDAGDGLRDLRGSLGRVTVSAGNAASSFGGGAGLRGKLIGVAAALGTALLPTMGAFAPMLSGLVVVGGGAALAMDDLKKKAKELKPAFESWQKATERAIAPHTTRAVKSLKGAMKDLEPSLVLGAETFGSITERASKFAASPVFQSAFQKNVQMGVVWVEDFAGSIGTFTQAFLEFGTKSQPALDAWQELLGGFLDTGLPSMFKEMEQGISGSSQLLSGLASFLNEGLLPALGKVAGSFGDAFGPLVGELLRTTGQALLGFGTVFEGVMETLKPVARIAADALHAFTDIMVIGSEVAGSLARNIGGALVDALLTVTGIDTDGMTGGFTKLSDWVDQNANRIRGVFFDLAGGITTFVTVGLSMLPKLFEGFRWLSESVLDTVGGMLMGLSVALGDMPGMGWLKDANKAFVDFSTEFRGTLDKAGEGINSFVDEAVPNLNRVQLKLKVDEAEANLAHIKEQLKDPELTEERRAELTADKTKAEEAVRQARQDLADFDGKSATGTIKGNNRPFLGALGDVIAKKIPSKTGAIKANRAPFDSVVGGIAGTVVGEAYINVYSRRVDNSAAKPFRSSGGPVQRRADGGALQHFPNGGPVEGPGGPRSDSIFATFASGGSAMVSDTEYVVQSSAVKKYGLPLLDALNRGTLKLAGGGVTKKEAAARKEAWSDLTLSRFGKAAGYVRSEFRRDLGGPDSLSALVSSLNQWRSVAMKATHGGTEKNLLRVLDQSGGLLLKWQKQLTSSTASLEKAREKLNALRSAASQLATSVKSGVLNSANITRRQGDGPVTVASVMGGLTASRDKATAFSKALADLRKKGLSSALIQQIGEAGIEGGGLETAGALLNASKSEIKSLNSLQSQINSAAAAAGKTTADAVYGAQIAAQERTVRALTTTVRTLTSKMDKLAAAMEKVFERAFKSKATGGIIGAASGGARSSWTLVGEHAPELVRLPFGSRVYSGPDTRRMQQQAWASMLTTPKSGARHAPAGQERARPVEIVIRSGGSQLDDAIVAIIRKSVAASGGDVQAHLGQGHYRIQGDRITF
ncbi:hypothetical protein ACFUG9_34000 [Streptomyces griseoincarnatus]